MILKSAIQARETCGLAEVENGFCIDLPSS
jgi:hypothetical protein